MHSIYVVPENLRRIHTDFPVLRYGRCEGPVASRNLEYSQLEICVRLSDTEKYAVDIINGREYRTPFPHVILKRPGYRYWYRSSGQRVVRYFYYPRESIPIMERYGMDFSTLIWPIVRTHNLDMLLEESDRHAEQLHTLGTPEQVDAVFWRILLELYLCRDSMAHVPDFNEKKIRMAASYLCSHCLEKIDLPQLIASCGMSRRSFYLHWRRFYSLSPSQFILHQKILYAKHLLRTTDDPVFVIAEKLSFSGIYFIRAFRKVTGCTPFRYRKTSDEML